LSGAGLFGPSGVPVGRSFSISQGIVNDALREAIEAVQETHGDGELPTIPIRTVDLGRHSRFRSRGRMVIGRESGLPVAILIAPNENHRAFTTVHEIGHVLDLCCLADPGAFASNFASQLEPWRRAVARTDSVAELRRLADLASVEVIGSDGIPRRFEVDRLFAAELLQLEELWARSYAQYVAMRSTSPRLRESLNALRRRDRDRVYYPLQWEDDEFGTVDEAIEALFRRLQWRESQGH
jgi:hypothetical protein